MAQCYSEICRLGDCCGAFLASDGFLLMAKFVLVIDCDSKLMVPYPTSWASTIDRKVEPDQGILPGVEG